MRDERRDKGFTAANHEAGQVPGETADCSRYRNREQKDLTIGPIKITGIPDREYTRKKNARIRHKALLEAKEAELLELTCQAEEYIDSIQKSELRTMFRFYFIDGLTFVKTAEYMNNEYPNRKIKYTDENVKKRIQRYFKKLENVPQCPEEIC